MSRLTRVREQLEAVASLDPDDIVSSGTFQVFTEEARELIDAIELHETMRVLVHDKQISPVLVRLLRDSSTVETLQMLAAKRRSA